MIRPAKVEDASRLHEIHLRAVRRGGVGYYPQEILEVWNEGRSPKGMADAIRAGGFYVAVESDLPVAFLHLQGSTLVALYVDPDRQGRGYGSQLFRHADVSIETRPLRLQANLNSVNFYLRMGCARGPIRAVRKHDRDIYVCEMTKE